MAKFKIIALWITEFLLLAIIASSLWQFFGDGYGFLNLKEYIGKIEAVIITIFTTVLPIVIIIYVGAKIAELSE